MNLKDHIRGIPDFPKPGIYFYDISTLLRHPHAWQVAMGRMARAVRAYMPDLVAGLRRLPGARSGGRRRGAVAPDRTAGRAWHFGGRY